MKKMKFLLSFLVVGMIFISSCSAPKIMYDYDRAAKFSTYKTFDFYPEIQLYMNQLDSTRYQSRTLSCGERSMLYSAYLGEAQSLAEELAAHQHPLQHHDDVELEELKFFSVPEASSVKRTA